MTTFIKNQDGPAQPDAALTLHLTEITALTYPEGSHEYRGFIRFLDPTENVQFEHLLPCRRKPEWLINVRHTGATHLGLSIQSRPADTQTWLDIGRLALPIHPYSDQLHGTTVTLPLLGWNGSIQLQMRIRLAVGKTDELADRSRPDRSADQATDPAIRPTNRRFSFPGLNRAGPSSAGFDIPPDSPATDIPADAAGAISPLTAPEQVLVKDVWNKFLAFQDMLIELFFERLLYDEPALADCFGEAVDLAPTYFAQLFDLSVRQLLPHTERTLREGYRGIYPTPPAGCRTTRDCATLLTDLGMRPRHWLTARRVWVWTLLQVPYLDEYDRRNLTGGVQSAAYRFFTLHILAPALAIGQQYDSALTPAIIREIRRCGEVMADDALAAGIDFYRLLFQTHPEVIPYFGRTDVDSLARHLMQAVAFLVRSLDAGRDVTLELRELGRVHTNFSVPPDAYPKIVGPMLTVMKQRIAGFTPDLENAWRVLLQRVSTVLQQPMVNRQRLLAQAKEFSTLVSIELAWDPADADRRWGEIEREIQATGTYTHTYEELAYGAQLAWRNAPKCIGRIAWRNLIVRDLRHVTDPDEMFRECVEHLRMGTNGGSMQIVMNVFRPKKPLERWGPRIWNPQYIRFAGYEQPDGTVLGDAANTALTKALIRQGWVPPATRTAFDKLPLVIDVPGKAPKLYEFADDDVLMVPLEHPAYPEVAALDLKWCAIPAITNFRMEIGGLQYGCMPFNGWFMETEISRNLWEEGRYNKAAAIADALGLDTSGEQTLWRDRAMLELNVAVLHSFAKAKVTLVDHQTASSQFLIHDQREKRAGRECPAQWSWVVPASGGSSTAVWHHEMRDFFLSPSYHYAADKWAVIDAELSIAGEQTATAETGGAHILILYGSETGTAENYARQTARRLGRHHPHILALDDYDPAHLGRETLVLVITSTFGNGSVPDNARRFYEHIQRQSANAFTGLTFSVMALGSTVYPDFCAAGTAIDREFARIGGNRVVAMHRGDEIKGQAETFQQWLGLIARLLGEDPGSANSFARNTNRLLVSFIPANQLPAAGPDPSRQERPGVRVPVVENRELLTEVIVGSRSTRSIIFDITGTMVTYETGDHVAIYPHNPPALVQRLCHRVGVESAAWFTTVPTDPEPAIGQPAPAYPQPVTVGQVLTEDLDLALREPLDELIAALLAAAEATSDREVLTVWVETLEHGEQDENCRVLKKYLTDTFMTVADLLDAFPSARLRFDQLLSLLPRQKPRLYSISSAPLVHPNQIQITVGVVEVVTDSGQTRPGLCSAYLAGLHPGSATVRLAVRSSGFHPPRDPQAPLLMVGPGTGISPFMGFLHHREAQLRALDRTQYCPFLRAGSAVNADSRGSVVRPGGYTRLFFGCRNETDYLYRPALEAWHKAGVLTHLDVAFSRRGDTKVYVQDLMQQHDRAIWDMLLRPDCHYYVCGDARMANDVFAVLMHIAQTVGNLSHAQAIDFFQTMQQEHRFMTDVWGVLLHFRQALPAMQEASYGQGKRWLARLPALSVDL